MNGHGGHGGHGGRWLSALSYPMPPDGRRPREALCGGDGQENDMWAKIGKLDMALEKTRSEMRSRLGQLTESQQAQYHQIAAMGTDLQQAKVHRQTLDRSHAQLRTNHTELHMKMKAFEERCSWPMCSTTPQSSSPSPDSRSVIMHFF